VHDEASGWTAPALDTALVGINNRDLRSFATSLKYPSGWRRASHRPHRRRRTLSAHADIVRLAAAVHAFLVGEA
jgi:indole-3-glycerol phosphate synthase